MKSPNLKVSLAALTVYLAGSDEHALRAIEDSLLLVTILLQYKSG